MKSQTIFIVLLSNSLIFGIIVNIKLKKISFYTWIISSYFNIPTKINVSAAGEPYSKYVPG